MSVSKRIGLAVGVAVVTVATMILLGWLLDRPSGQGSGIAKIGGPFELIDQSGKSVTDDDYRGRYMLIYFGYSYCPDVCPTELHKMGVALDQLGERARNIVPIFITVDPERDDPAHLAGYVSNFHERMIGLTGTADQIARVAKEYRIYFRRVDDASATEYLMDHSSIIYLMGPDGKYVTHFTHGTSAEDLARRLKELT